MLNKADMDRLRCITPTKDYERAVSATMRVHASKQLKEAQQLVAMIGPTAEVGRKIAQATAAVLCTHGAIIEEFPTWTCNDCGFCMAFHV